MNDVDALDLFAIVALHGHLSSGRVKDLTLDELAEHCYAMAKSMYLARIKLDDEDYEDWMGS